VKSIGGLVLFAAAGTLGRDVGEIGGAGAPGVKATSCGPLLVEGLSFRLTPDGAEAYHGATRVFAVDQVGRELLSYADGTHSLEEIAARTGMVDSAAEVALFFVELGKAGYLQNKVVVSIVEHAT